MYYISNIIKKYKKKSVYTSVCTKSLRIFEVFIRIVESIVEFFELSNQQNC